MIFLLLSIACSTLLVIILKLFPKYGVDTLHGIVVNYLTCIGVGMLVTHISFSDLNKGWSAPWLPVSVILGALFITVFNLSALTSQKLGIGVASMAMKLALVFPILLGFIIYHEPFPVLKIIGVSMAIVAVVMTSIRDTKSEPDHKGKLMLILPSLVFFGSGACDSSVQYAQNTFFREGGFELFSIFLFLIAAILGSIYAIIIYFVKKEMMHKRSIIGGLILGVPNYLSIYFLFKALNSSEYESTIIFPLANISVVVSSAVIGYFLFKEKQSRLNLAGLLLAVVSIAMIIYSKS